MDERKKIAKLIIGFLCLIFLEISIPAEEGSAGLESPFDMIGVSAKDMAMGSAAVAYPDNIGAFLWNPGGLVVVDQIQVGLSQTMLFEGTQYHFMSYVHPTLTAGTFGIGISRIGIGGIEHFEEIGGVPVHMGSYDYWWGKISLAYAHTIISGFSLGLNFDANRQELGPDNTNGFGLDAGIHFRSPIRYGFFRNFFLGVNFKNLMSPRMKLGDETEKLPPYFRAGVGKSFLFGDYRWTILGDYQQLKERDATLHFGTEFGWRRIAFIRLGLDNQDLTFGGGLRFKGVQIDYGSAPMGDPVFFPRSHRFSISFHIGKSIPEQKRLLIEAEENRIRQQVTERQEAERNRRIQTGLTEGKEFFESGDYFNSRLAFSRVLSEDPDNAEAQKYLTMTGEREEAQQKEREETLRNESIKEEQNRVDQAFIRERYEEGLHALDQGDFNKAILQWEEAIERDPENEQISSYLTKAKRALETEIGRLIARANTLIRQENIAEARRVLDWAKEQTENNEPLRNKVMVEIKRLDNTVNFMNHYQLGRENYEKGNYTAAANYLEKAFQLRPNDDEVRELLRSARGRAIGVKKEMENDVKRQFAEGLRLYSEGHYKEALAAWEKSLDMDPKNIKIIESIDVVKRKIQQLEQN
jgi:tetratricopeptide (TPR) repeat protein